MRNSVLLGLSFGLDPSIQADTAITQCCNFSRDSLALKTENEAPSGVVYSVKTLVPAQSPMELHMRV